MGAGRCPDPLSRNSSPELVLTCLMRKPAWILLVTMAVAVGSTFLYLGFSRNSKPIVTGPLTQEDTRQIEHFISRERAALIGSEFAPHDAMNFVRNLRERAGGVLRRITAVSSQYVVVDFGDRWDSRQGYDYELRRTTNGWKITGVGRYRTPER